MPKHQDNNELLVCLMSMNDLWPVMRHKMVAVAMQMSRGGSGMAAKDGVHLQNVKYQCLCGCFDEPALPLPHMCRQS